ncbi:MAG TPA: hypothetical protein VGW33_15000 [Terriglobia bacterium]|nr:hypothetical protein [Terriglobia bacterium]
MKTTWKVLVAILVVLGFSVSPRGLRGDTSEDSRQALSKLLLGKEVKALIELPATKEGLNVYMRAEGNKRLDERGIDMGSLSKYLKSKGVGVDANESATITDVKVDSDRVEIHLGGGGEGRRGSKHANKVSPGYKRAGGSRINFRYERNLTDSDIAPEDFLKAMGRVLDVSDIQNDIAEAGFPTEFKQAISEKMVKEGMTYQMVILAFGDPEQKKINDTTDGSLSETWYYLKEGHRWVLSFINGKVTKVQAF